MADSLVLARDWMQPRAGRVVHIQAVRAGVQTPVVERTDLKEVVGRAVAAVARTGSAVHAEDLAEERFAVVEGSHSPVVADQAHEKTACYPLASQTVRSPTLAAHSSAVDRPLVPYSEARRMGLRAVLAWVFVAGSAVLPAEP
jgi:hypothetical protein